MSYRLKHREGVPHGVRRIVAEETAYAAEQLTGAGTENRDTQVHEARKSIKKLRGLLKLLRPELKSVWRQENAILRAAGRELSELRDAGAMLETFDQLAAKHAGELQKSSFRAVHAGLKEAKSRLEQALNLAEVSARSVEALKSLAQRSASWGLQHNDFKALAPGLRATYKEGRRAMRAAIKQDTAEAFHNWRKRVKDHWYHVRLLEHAAPKEMEARENQLHGLETALGEDHNLAVLRELVSSKPDRFGGSDVVRVFCALAKQEQKHLRDSALILGKELYATHAKDWAGAVEEQWREWLQQQHKPVAKRKSSLTPVRRRTVAA